MPGAQSLRCSASTVRRHGSRDLATPGPASACVGEPSAMTGTPLTSTHCMPTESWLGAGRSHRSVMCSDRTPRCRPTGPTLMHAAVVEPQPRGRQAGELADGLLEAHAPLLAHVLAQHARKRPVGARVRKLLAEHAPRARCRHCRCRTRPRAATAASAMSGSLMANTAASRLGVDPRSGCRTAYPSGPCRVPWRRRRACALGCCSSVGLFTVEIRMASGPGHRLPFVVPVGRRRSRAPSSGVRGSAGSFSRSMSFALPPSCAHGGMKADSSLAHAG